MRGFSLILCLLLGALILIAGAAMLTSQQEQYHWAELTRLGLQARALARAGLDDALIKLDKDVDFPPSTSLDQPRYTYTEELGDGSYTVVLDASFREPPWQVLIVTSIGRVGPTEAPRAVRVLRGQLDLARQDRSSPAQPNRSYFKLITLEEGPGG